jgi:hypothetical protein
MHRSRAPASALYIAEEFDLIASLLLDHDEGRKRLCSRPTWHDGTHKLPEIAA